MSLLTKSALGFVAAGTTAAGAAYAGGLFDGKEKEKEKTSISKLLQSLNPEKRLIMASEGSDPSWKEAGKNYKAKYSGKGLDPLKVLSGKALASDEAAPADFMSSCKDLFDVKVVDGKDDSYQLVLNHCTRLTLVSDGVADRGHELVSQTDGADTSAGTSLWKKYKDAGKNAGSVSEYSSHQEGQEVPASFKKKCSDESSVAQGNKEDPSVENVFLFCSKKKAD